MKTTTTSKLFHGRYGHRLIIKLNKDTLFVKDRLRTFRGDHKIVVRTAYVPTKGFSLYYGAWEDDRMMVYFNDASLVDHLLRKRQSRQSLLELTSPASDLHLTEMKSDAKVIVRDKLYHGLYRYVHRIPYKGSWWRPEPRDHITDAQDWCRDTLAEGAWRDGGVSNGAFFFKEASDAVLFKLVHGDIIGSSERVLLTSELQTQRCPEESSENQTTGA